MSSSENPRNTYFFNHFHTPESNTHFDQLVGSENGEGQNHYGCPEKILENLGKGENAVITITEHYKTNGLDYFQEIADIVEEKGGEYDLGAYSLDLALEESKLRIMNGVETSFKEESNHVVLGGLRLDNEQEYLGLDGESLREAADNALYAHPAHPHMLSFGLEDRTLEEVCEILDNSEAELFMPETHAYGLGDSIARGSFQKNFNGNKDIYDTANDYNAAIIPEHDHHVHLPSRMNGIGLLRDSAVQNNEGELAAAETQEELPIDEIKNGHVIKSSNRDQLKDSLRFSKSYADLWPLWKKDSKLMQILGIPSNQDEFKSIRDDMYSTISEMSTAKANARSRSLN